MNTQQIKRAKRLAEILGIDDLEERDGRLLHMASDGPLSFMPVGEFNPEQDKALLWNLMVEQGVTVDRYLSECYMITFGDSPDGMDSGETLCEIEFKETSEIPAALIDCVIEINGGYDE